MRESNVYEVEIVTFDNGNNDLLGSVIICQFDFVYRAENAFGLRGFNIWVLGLLRAIWQKRTGNTPESARKPTSNTAVPLRKRPRSH